MVVPDSTLPPWKHVGASSSKAVVAVVPVVRARVALTAIMGQKGVQLLHV